jgi:hypothetical protein
VNWRSRWLTRLRSYRPLRDPAGVGVQSTPAGHKKKGLSPRIVDYRPFFGAKSS